MTDSDLGHAEGSSGESDAEADPLIGKVIGDRYRVDEKLGVGGMGAVYRAEHVLLRKSVAVKVLHRELTAVSEIVQRFEREAFAAGRIDHPNVAVATDFNKLEDGAFYLVLEYVAGKSLAEVIRDEAPLHVERVLFIARQVAGALAAAHAAGIVHRDLKPDNVMLIERGGTKDFVKVLDFGIAKLSSEATSTGPLTRLGVVYGTPAYMAPEQAAGKNVDHRADLYSLGHVMYEMLAGRPAFEAMELIGLLTKQLTETPPPLPESIDEGVRSLVMKMLEKEPDARLGSAAELVAAIDAQLGTAVLPVDSTVLGVTSVRGQAMPDSGPASQAVAPTAAAVTAPVSVRLKPALRRLFAGTERLSALAKRAAGGETVRLIGRDVPLWLAGAAAGAVIMAIVLTATLMRTGPSAPAARHETPTGVPAKDMTKVIALAAGGDRAALAELTSIPEKERTAPEWLAMAKGYEGASRHKEALQAFERAVTLDPRLGTDMAMLRMVRRAVDDAETRQVALNLAAERLGEAGADILYDVWTSRPSPKSDAPQLAKSLLEKDEVRAHASKALAVALELRRANRCDEAKRLLPVAIDNADERSVRSLTAFSSRRGCGFLGLGDCYSCLRRGGELAHALSAAEARKAPKY